MVRGAPVYTPAPAGTTSISNASAAAVHPPSKKCRQKIRGPLLDRIGLHVDVPTVEYKTIASGETGASSQDIRDRVERARAIQRDRFAKEKGVHTDLAADEKVLSHHVLEAINYRTLDRAMWS